MHRPWIADDGALIRLRLPGGRLPTQALLELRSICTEYGDGNLYLTSRANVQLRSIPYRDDQILPEAIDRIRSTGLLPSDSHELVRNIMVSPLTGLAGGNADLRPAVAALDRALLSEDSCASLPGRFLFILDDGRGDLRNRPLDFGAVALDSSTAQLRIGSNRWGPTVDIAELPSALVAYAIRFQAVRGSAWHVDELPGLEAIFPEQASEHTLTQCSGDARPSGTFTQTDGRHAQVIDVPDGVLTESIAHQICSRASDHVIVTPWRSVVLPDRQPS